MFFFAGLVFFLLLDILQGWLVWNIGTSSPEASEGLQSHQVMPPLFFFFLRLIQYSVETIENVDVNIVAILITPKQISLGEGPEFLRV